MALRSLRRHAKTNLCDACYEKYVALIEPTIERFLLVPLEDWRWVESLVTMMVMKHKGVFKGKLLFEQLGQDAEKFADEVDIKAFRETKKWKFSKKLKYLCDNGILQKDSYRFLDAVRNIRNRIHGPFGGFTEHELALFSVARAITAWTYEAMILDLGKALSKKIRSDAEETATYWLSRISDG